MAAEAFGAAVLAPEQIRRVFRDIDSKRRVAGVLGAEPTPAWRWLVEPALRRPHAQERLERRAGLVR